MAENNPFEEYLRKEQANSQQPLQTQQANDPFAEYLKNNPVDPIKTSEQVAWEDADFDETMAAFTFLEGLTFGFSDEAIAAIEAGYEAATTDKDFGDAYEQARIDYKLRKDQFEAENPNLALGLEVTGAIVNPLNFMGKFTGGYKAAKMAARAGAEGALFGFGSADVERSDEAFSDRLESAAFGGLTGFGVGSVVGGAGAVYNQATKRRIAQEVAGESDVPITLAVKENDGVGAKLVSRLYRDVVAPSFGGGKIQEAERRVLGESEMAVSQAKQGFEAANKALKSEQNRIKAFFLNKTNKVKSAAQNMRYAIDDAKVDATESTTRMYSELLESVKGDVNEVSRLTRQLGDNIELQNTNFRLLSFDSSMPAAIRKKGNKALIEEIIDNSTGNPNRQMQLLEDAWKKMGFESIHRRSFKINLNQLASQIEKDLSDDVLLKMGATAPTVQKNIGAALSLIEEGVKNGRINGKTLSTARAKLGMASSKLGNEGEAAIQSAVIKQAQKRIDDVIEGQLTGNYLKQFKADKAAWRTLGHLKDVVTKNTKAGVQGRFSPSDWMDSVRTLDPVNARRGVGVLQRQADDVAMSVKKGEELIKKGADDLTTALKNRKARHLSAHRRKATTEKRKLQARENEIKHKIQGRQERALELPKLQQDIKLAEVAEQSAKEELDTLKKLASVENPTWYHKFAANSQLMAFGLGAVQNTAKTAVGATGVGSALASKTGQRLMAGQTGLQQGLNKLSQSQGLFGGTVAENVLQTSPILAKTLQMESGE